MHRKWVKLWRRAEDALIPQAYRWQLFSYLLVKATHTPITHTSRKNGTSVELQPGQLVTATRTLAKILRRPRVSLQRDLRWMVDQRMIQVTDLGWATLVTIRNWKRFQNPELAAGPATDDALVQEVMADLNATLDAHGVTAAKRVKGGARFTKLVMDRVNVDKATLAQFRHVHQVKAAEWAGDPEMEKFLRPSTLYGASHWEDYVNQGDGPGGTREPWQPPERE